MEAYKDLNSYIMNAPNRIIPFDIKLHVYLLRQLFDKDTYVDQYFQSEIDSYKKKNNFSENKIPDIKNNIIQELRKEENYFVLKSTRILYKGIEVPEDMMQCDNCGNIWDGCAQCPCYLDIYY